MNGPRSGLMRMNCCESNEMCCTSCFVKMKRRQEKWLEFVGQRSWDVQLTSLDYRRVMLFTGSSGFLLFCVCIFQAREPPSQSPKSSTPQSWRLSTLRHQHHEATMALCTAVKCNKHVHVHPQAHPDRRQAQALCMMTIGNRQSSNQIRATSHRARAS